jgi:RpiR family carbohydrate utilization transcriptional regulator
VDGALSPSGNGAAGLLERLAVRRSSLTPSEARVAEVVLDRPDAIPRMNLAALANMAAVSEPTVLRFCRSLGTDGFAEFKLEMARALSAGGAAYVHREIGFGDAVATVCAKVFQSSINALSVVGQRLDPAVVEQAIDILAGARRIDCIAAGLSTIVAIDAQQKLMRLQVPCAAHHDGHLQTLSAATLGPGDVALVFSYHGRVRDALRAARTAREAGATTIAVTRSDTPLARAVDLCIPVDTPEDTFVYSPMTTRLAHLAVLDVLATGVALRRGPAIAAHLERIKESMSDQWIMDEEPPPAARRGRRTAREAT